MGKNDLVISGKEVKKLFSEAVALVGEPEDCEWWFEEDGVLGSVAYDESKKEYRKSIDVKDLIRNLFIELLVERINQETRNEFISDSQDNFDSLIENLEVAKTKLEESLGGEDFCDKYFSQGFDFSYGKMKKRGND